MTIINSPHEIRILIRNGEYQKQTAGFASKYVQGNICILPDKYKNDFLEFCKKNPKPCPLIGFSENGEVKLSKLGDIDIRTDVPVYRVWKEGKIIDEPVSIEKYWKNDFSTFVLGCSMSFELPLIDAGIEIQHIKNNTIVPMYKTNIECESSGIFKGNMVVSMRPLNIPNTIKAIEISSKYPDVHGAPVHFSNPKDIGIKDIMSPDYGDPPQLINADEIPVFWACGVTPQLIIENLKLDFCITHKPGCMLITDKLNENFKVNLS